MTRTDANKAGEQRPVSHLLLPFQRRLEALLDEAPAGGNHRPHPPVRPGNLVQRKQYLCMVNPIAGGVAFFDELTQELALLGGQRYLVFDVGLEHIPFRL